MTRETIDFGIDLGTSNSSVAVFSGERVEIIRNNENNELTPSVVRYLPNGTVQVGQAAYQYLRMPDAAGSTLARFKRSMGQQEPYLVESTGAEVTPEMLAAEVLKSLRQDAEVWEGKSVDRAVITVPAMFDLTQCEATTRAASMAGIRQAPLLQEPIAAGLAYGYDNNADDGYLLVYDIGPAPWMSRSSGSKRDAFSSRDRRGQLSRRKRLGSAPMQIGFGTTGCSRGTTFGKSMILTDTSSEHDSSS